MKKNDVAYLDYLESKFKSSQRKMFIVAAISSIKGVPLDMFKVFGFSDDDIRTFILKGTRIIEKENIDIGKYLQENFPTVGKKG